MADEKTEVAAESVSTPSEAVTEAAEPFDPNTSVERDIPQTGAGWDNLGKSEEQEEVKTEEESKVGDEATAEAVAEAETEKAEEIPEEDKVLEELFSDKELDNLNPEEMIAAQGSRRKKLWAQRNFREAEIVREFTNPEIPITAVLEKLEKADPKRYGELTQNAAHRLVDVNPNAAFQRAYVQTMLAKNPNWDWQNASIPTLDSIIATGAETKTSETSNSELSAITAKLDAYHAFDWRDPANDARIENPEDLAAVQAIRLLESTVKAKDQENTEQSEKNKALEERLKKIEGGVQQQELTNLEKARQSKAYDFRESVKSKVLPFIAKSNGLEIDDNDTPTMKSFKQSLMAKYEGRDYEQKDNVLSEFEYFAENVSSVKSDIAVVVKRVVNAQLEEAKAELAGDAAKAEQYRKQAEDERVPLYELYAQANNEFKKREIDPFLAVIEELSTSLSTKINESSQRVEVTGSGAPTTLKQPEVESETAEDVWSNMVKSAQKDQALRAA